MSEKARSDRVVLGDLIIGSSMLFERIGKKVRFAFATNINLSVGVNQFINVVDGDVLEDYFRNQSKVVHLWQEG